MSKTINWGILGLGNIANNFAHDLILMPNGKLHGVASRSLDKAKQFSQKYSATRYYGSYEELAKDPEIDVVYIATPHVFHFENTMMCLQEGKSVLCEKPLGVNTNEVKIMIEEASSRNLFLMEALWTRFIPSTEKLLGLIKSKIIGDVKFMRADFGFKGDTNPNGRLFNRSLGGGSLLDIGIYPIYLSLLTLGIPNDIKAMARISNTQVDSYCAMLFDYNNSEKAVLESTFEAETPTEAIIYGDKGAIKMHSPFHHSKRLSIWQNKELNKIIDIAYKGNGLYHEIEEVTHCLLKGKTESSKMTHKDSLDLITLMDKINQQIGLSFDTLKSK